MNHLSLTDQIHKSWCQDDLTDCVRCARIQDDLIFFARVEEEKKAKAYWKSLKRNSKEGLGVYC